MARRKAPQSVTMSGEGERVRSRRERLGISKAELAREANVGRHTLSAIEKGEGFRRSSLTKLERALDSLETEAGFDAPDAAGGDEDLMTVEVQLPDGRTARVITKASSPPGRAADEVAALLQRMAESDES